MIHLLIDDRVGEVKVRIRLNQIIDSKLCAGLSGVKWASDLFIKKDEIGYLLVGD